MEYPQVSEDDLKILIPSGVVVSGPSGSGKTQLVLKLLRHADSIFKPAPKKIGMLLQNGLSNYCSVWAYGEYSPLIPELEREHGVIVHAGLPDDEMLNQLPKNFVLVCDDLMGEVEPKRLADLYTKKAHHRGFCILYLVQNLFDKAMRVPRTNAQYLFLMRSPNDMLSIRNLSHQIFPKQSSFFLDAYSQSCSEPYGYLFGKLLIFNI
jgi:hypothetical protein